MPILVRKGPAGSLLGVVIDARGLSPRDCALLRRDLENHMKRFERGSWSSGCSMSDWETLLTMNLDGRPGTFMRAAVVFERDQPKTSSASSCATDPGDENAAGCHDGARPTGPANAPDAS